MSKTGLPAISWTANENHLTWLLLTEMEKYENYRVLFGKVDKEEVRLKFLRVLTRLFVYKLLIYLLEHLQ